MAKFLSRIAPDPYREFIASKRRIVQPMGFEPSRISPFLFDWQALIESWATRRGRAALFEDCGLGKTLQQLEWAAQVWQHTQRPVVIHCPVGVRHQTKAEAEKFNIDAPIAIANESDSVIDGINLINYEKLHRIDPSIFGGVVLDESSILKSFTGKIKQSLIAAYSHCPYRLACTATPAPNDFMELGNHAEFLGVCTREEMLSTYFVHDSGETSKWRLRKHAQKDFWEWMASWSVCVSKPSDIGFSDNGFDLPPLVEHEHIVDIERDPKPGFLFHVDEKLSATAMHSEKRQTADLRAAKVAELVNSNSESWAVWCDANYEADALKKLIPDAVEVRGTDSDQSKEDRLRSFADGSSRVIITKPTVAGFGMNWQHCSHQAKIGVNYSYEQSYQADRRLWRFGQRRPVHSHIVTTPSEKAMLDAQKAKASQHQSMKHGMAAAMRESMAKQLKSEDRKEKYEPRRKMRLPQWLTVEESPAA